MNKKELIDYIKRQKELIKNKELLIDRLVDEVNGYKEILYKLELEKITQDKGEHND